MDALCKGIAPQVNFQPYARNRDIDSATVRRLVSFATHSKRRGRGVALAGHCGGFSALGDGLAVMGSRWDIQAVGDNAKNLIYCVSYVGLSGVWNLYSGTKPTPQPVRRARPVKSPSIHKGVRRKYLVHRDRLSEHPHRRGGKFPFVGCVALWRRFNLSGMGRRMVSARSGVVAWRMVEMKAQIELVANFSLKFAEVEYNEETEKKIQKIADELKKKMMSVLGVQPEADIHWDVRISAPRLYDLDEVVK